MALDISFCPRSVKAKFLQSTRLTAHEKHNMNDMLGRCFGAQSYANSLENNEQPKHYGEEARTRGRGGRRKWRGRKPHETWMFLCGWPLR